MSVQLLRQRFAVLGVAAGVALGVPVLGSAPAAAQATNGYVRLAHLSPDTPAVDVYLSSVNGTISTQKFPSVPYGVVSDYQLLPTGTYAVSMRAEGASESAPPLLTTQVTVATDKAYTVAGVGRRADLGLRVINDDFVLPPDGKAKVRIVQASVRAPVLDVTGGDGSTVATGVPFASTTSYQEVNAGDWSLRVTAAGGSPSTTLQARLGSGNCYSLLVLDGPNNTFTAKVLVDARRQGGVPVGGVETGAGGAARLNTLPAFIGGAVMILVAVGGLMVTRQRRPRRQ